MSSLPLETRATRNVYERHMESSQTHRLDRAPRLMRPVYARRLRGPRKKRKALRGWRVPKHHKRTVSLGGSYGGG